MQKVAKELLSVAEDQVKFILDTPMACNNVNDITVLLQHRFASLLVRLAKIMGKTEDTYTTWMHQQSSLIQDTARAYGEVVCWEQFKHAIGQAHSEATKYAIFVLMTFRHVLTVMARIHGLTLINRDLSFYMASNAILNPTSILPSLHAAIAEFFPLSMIAINAFGIPEHMLRAPIARDWVKYNEGDNQGNGSHFFPCRRALQRMVKV